MSVEAKLKELGISLPPAPRPVAAYVPAVKSGNLLFLSGVIPFVNGKMTHVGKLGKEISTEDGYEAARISLLNALAIIKSELGSLDQVKQIVKLTGYVASSPGFTQQPQVINGASDLLIKLFGEKGLHARVSVGVAELPLGASIEIELVVELKG
ncbi:MAG TPA: RidA family protein [Nitrospiria bacterium]|jgi:enamine deaminase RidA (YjgF/YER057c/UK114 family)